MNKNDRFGTIIDVKYLARLMNDPDPRCPLIIIDCRFSLADPDYGRSQYQQSHLPGAFFADLDKDLSRPPIAGEGRHPLPDANRFSELLGRFGFSSKSQVVVYDDAAGGVAGRCWWMLRHWIGHSRVAVLDGDFRAWKNAALPLTDVVPELSNGAYSAIVNSAVLADTGEIISVSEDRATDASTVIDARSAERFRGEAEPVDPIAGHIPRSLNMPLTANLGDDGHFLSATELKARFGALADGKADQVIHSCGSGVSACHNLLAMDIAGLTGSRLYVGSWSEWIADPARTVATGDV